MAPIPKAPIVKVCAAFAPSTSGVRLTLTATDLRAEAKAHFEAGRFFNALESYTGCIQLRVCLTGLEPPSRLKIDLPLTRASSALDSRLHHCTATER